MKFKCNISGNVYDFVTPLDIKALKASQDYSLMPDGTPVGASVAPKPATPAKPPPA